MAYEMKSKSEFDNALKKYLEENPIGKGYEEGLIEEFSSNNLSDLYELLLDIKGYNLGKEQFSKLRNKIKSNFVEDVANIFNENEYAISCNEVNALGEIIKKKFLEEVGKQPKDIDEDEFFRLTLIVNKVYPETFLKLIKNPKSNISKDKEIITGRFLDAIDEWSLHTGENAEEENKDILGALYITASKIYPEMSIYIPGRVKAMKSGVSNFEKETKRSIGSIIPKKFDEGITSEEVEEQFSLEKATGDFSGFTIVLGNTDDTMHFDIGNERTKELLKLRKYRDYCIRFSHSFENFLYENAGLHYSNRELWQMKVELLTKLRKLTYDECRKEYKGTSFLKMLRDTLKQGYDEYDYDEDYNEEYDYSDNVENSDYEKKEAEIYDLLDELKKRVHDKYQAKILEIAVPEILGDECICNTMHIKSKYVKSVKKPNGFCADYYQLKTANGRKIELQAITKMRFKESKDGSSAHFKMPNKNEDISQFFEPASEKYKDSFERMVKLLDKTTVAEKNRLYLKPIYDLSPKDKRLRRDLERAQKCVKLKESFVHKHKFEDGAILINKYSLNKYLIYYAQYITPKQMSVGSPHTRFNKGIAGYDKKSMISAFTEVLLKNDSTPCLAQMLIDRLEQILPNDKNEVSRNGIIKRATERYKDVDNGENR